VDAKQVGVYKIKRERKTVKKKKGCSLSIEAILVVWRGGQRERAEKNSHGAKAWEKAIEKADKTHHNIERKSEEP